MSSEILDAYWAAPPMARTLATAIVVTSISVHFGLLSYAWFYFTEDRLFRLPPEIWRLATNFFLSGAQMGIIMDPYFAYQYLKQLETANLKFPRKEDVLWYLITVGGFIIVGPSLFFSAPSRLKRQPRISARMVLSLPTNAVPGNEEDYPRMSTGPSFA
jgi:hypothetical protein